MANTKITDIVGSEKLLGTLVSALIPAKNPFINSGVAIRAPEFDAVANGGPRKSSVPYLKPLDPSVVNISTDDLSTLGGVGKIEADEYTALRHDLNRGFGTADLVQMVTLYDAKGGIQAGLADYWNGVFQRTAVASLKGAFAATSASALSIGNTSTALSLNLIIDAAVDAGENADMFDTLIVHPTIYGNMQKTGKTVLDPTTGLATFGGYKLIVDKSFGSTKTVLARSGAFAFGLGTPAGKVPFEIERIAGGGNGGGGDVLWSRQSAVLHPQGFNYVGAVAPDQSALALGTNWTMDLDKEQIGFRYISHTANFVEPVTTVFVSNTTSNPIPTDEVGSA